MIKINDKYVIAICDVSYFFDLSIKKSAKVKGTPTEKIVPIAYGISLQRCVDIIAQNEILSDGDKLEMNGYLEKYESITKQTIKELTNFKLKD